MIRYLSLFSGIGAFEKALDNLGIPYELLAYCEVDKYASKAYSLLHHVPENMNLGDITKWTKRLCQPILTYLHTVFLARTFPLQETSVGSSMRTVLKPEADCSLTHCVSSNIANQKWLLLRM